MLRMSLWIGLGRIWHPFAGRDPLAAVPFRHAVKLAVRGVLHRHCRHVICHTDGVISKCARRRLWLRRRRRRCRLAQIVSDHDTRIRTRRCRLGCSRRCWLRLRANKAV